MQIEISIRYEMVLFTVFGFYKKNFYGDLEVSCREKCIQIRIINVDLYVLQTYIFRGFIMISVIELSSLFLSYQLCF